MVKDGKPVFGTKTAAETPSLFDSHGSAASEELPQDQTASAQQPIGKSPVEDAEPECKSNGEANAVAQRNCPDLESREKKERRRRRRRRNWT